MNRNGIYIPNTIWKQILGYTGWNGSFTELACFIGEPGLCPSSNQKEWWYTGGIRTRFLGKYGEISEEAIIYDGQDPKGRRSSNRRDIDQRSLFRDFTYFKSLTCQDPVSDALYSATRIGMFPPSSNERNISSTEEAMRYYSQRCYSITSKQHFNINLVVYDNEVLTNDIPIISNIVKNRYMHTLGHRGYPNYHLKYLNYTYNNAEPLAWQFQYGMVDYTDKDYVLVHSFIGIENSVYKYNTVSDTGISEKMNRYI